MLTSEQEALPQRSEGGWGGRSSLQEGFPAETFVIMGNRQKAEPHVVTVACLVSSCGTENVLDWF